jgi:hypothetical protein
MVMLMVVIFEDTLLKLVNEIHYVSLPINTAGLEAERFIMKKARQINICAYLVIAVFIICIPVYLPIFGSNREWFFNDLVVEEYFGWCSNIITFIVYSTTPFTIYTSFRLAGFMFYAIVQIYLQVFLINQHILHICVSRKCQTVKRLSTITRFSKSYVFVSSITLLWEGRIKKFLIKKKIHTHIYIYIYIYVWGKILLRRFLARNGTFEENLGISRSSSKFHATERYF